MAGRIMISHRSYTSFPDPRMFEDRTPLSRSRSMPLSQSNNPKSRDIFGATMGDFIVKAMWKVAQLVICSTRRRAKIRPSFRVNIKLHALEAYYRLDQLQSTIEFTDDQISAAVRPIENGLALEKSLINIQKEMAVTMSLLKQSPDLEPRIDLANEVLNLEELARRINKTIFILWLYRHDGEFRPSNCIGRVEETREMIEKQALSLRKFRSHFWREIQDRKEDSGRRRSGWEIPQNPMHFRRKSPEERLRLMHGTVQEYDLY